MEQKSKVIGTTKYLVTQMDAISALKIQTKLIKIIGPGIFSFIQGGANREKIGEIIPMLVENFDPEEVNTLILSLFERNVFIELNGHPKVIDFASHFIGKPIEMWKVAGFILEANFSTGELTGSDFPTT